MSLTSTCYKTEACKHKVMRLSCSDWMCSEQWKQARSWHSLYISHCIHNLGDIQSFVIYLAFVSPFLSLKTSCELPGSIELVTTLNGLWNWGKQRLQKTSAMLPYKWQWQLSVISQTRISILYGSETRKSSLPSALKKSLVSVAFVKATVWSGLNRTHTFVCLCHAVSKRDWFFTHWRRFCILCPLFNSKHKIRNISLQLQ